MLVFCARADFFQIFRPCQSFMLIKVKEFKKKKSDRRRENKPSAREDCGQVGPIKEWGRLGVAKYLPQVCVCVSYITDKTSNGGPCIFLPSSRDHRWWREKLPRWRPADSSHFIWWCALRWITGSCRRPWKPTESQSVFLHRNDFTRKFSTVLLLALLAYKEDWSSWKVWQQRPDSSRFQSFE